MGHDAGPYRPCADPNSAQHKAEAERGGRLRRDHPGVEGGRQCHQMQSAE